jgi:hypothetical protein
MEEEQQFLDLKKQPVSVGDYIMYPIMTHLRCGVVQKVYNSQCLAVKYSRPVWRVNDTIHIGRQVISCYDRSVVKINDEELSSIVTPEKYRRFRELHDEAINKNK